NDAGILDAKGAKGRCRHTVEPIMVAPLQIRWWSPALRRRSVSRPVTALLTTPVASQRKSRWLRPPPLVFVRERVLLPSNQKSRLVYPRPAIATIQVC